MKKFTLLLCLLSTTFVGWGQNLVPNGGFEGYSNCPTYYSQLNKVLFWINPNSATPDYFNACAIPASYVDIPDNLFGYQNAHGGMGYGGIYLIDIVPDTSPNYREYIETPLTASLTANSCYHFEMFINLGDTCKFTTDDLGVYFSDTAISGIPNYSALPFIPQLNNLTGILFDTLNWTLVSGNYNANGGENYLIIGNFKDDANTDTILINPSPFSGYVYVYIDDVSLTPCATGINETSNNTSTFTISPNPAADELNVQCSMFNVQEKEIKIYDVMGKEVLKSEINLQSSIINIQSLNSGIYFIEINGVRKKFVKN